jgi:hypothetical protein
MKRETHAHEPYARQGFDHRQTHKTNNNNNGTDKGQAGTLVEMDEMKALTSSWVGQLFWQGASAHLRHRSASHKAPRSDRVVCLMSLKSFFKSQPWKNKQTKKEG